MRRNALSSIGPMIGFVYSFFSEVIEGAEVHFCPDMFNDDYLNVPVLLSKVLSIFGLFFLVCSGFKWQAIGCTRFSLRSSWPSSMNRPKKQR